MSSDKQRFNVIISALPNKVSDRYTQEGNTEGFFINGTCYTATSLFVSLVSIVRKFTGKDLRESKEFLDGYFPAVIQECVDMELAKEIAGDFKALGCSVRIVNSDVNSEVITISCPDGTRFGDLEHMLSAGFPFLMNKVTGTPLVLLPVGVVVGNKKYTVVDHNTCDGCSEKRLDGITTELCSVTACGGSLNKDSKNTIWIEVS